MISNWNPLSNLDTSSPKENHSPILKALVKDMGAF